MKPVKMHQRYRCDFCTKRATRLKMEFHEKNCYKNPNRICSNCNNTGRVVVNNLPGLYVEAPCPYCAAYDEKKAHPTDYREPENIC